MAKKGGEKCPLAGTTLVSSEVTLACQEIWLLNEKYPSHKGCHHKEESWGTALSIEKKKLTYQPIQIFSSNFGQKLASSDPMTREMVLKETVVQVKREWKSSLKDLNS